MDRAGKAVPTHNLYPQDGKIPLFEIFVHDPLTVTNPVLEANLTPHRHSYYEIIHVTGGQGTHVIDFISYELRPPCLFFLSPGQVHFWDFQQPLEASIIYFREEFLLTSGLGSSGDGVALFQDMLNSPAVFLSPQQNEVLSPLVQALTAELRMNKESMQSILQAYFHIFLANFERMCLSGSGNSVADDLVRRFRVIVSKRTDGKVNVESLAAELGVSVRQLSGAVKQATGKSPKKILRDEIVLEAKRRLIHTRDSASQIGYSLGFEDPSYFGRFFKRETGMSPGEFKQQVKERFRL